MSSFGFRPHFRQLLDLDLASVEERLVERAGTEGHRCQVTRFPGFISLRIPDDEQHFWSPRLDLSLEKTEDGKTMVRGRYGPGANVWSLFLYGYVAIAFLGSIGSILGICQALIGYYPWGLWIVGAMAVLGLALYLLAQTGQKLGAQQTFQLHQAYETAIGVPVEVH